jgi:hypothetical protein
MIPHESVKIFLVLSHGACFGVACGAKSELRSRQLHITIHAVMDVAHPIAVFLPHYCSMAYRSLFTRITLSFEQLHNVLSTEKIISEKNV